MPVVAAGAARAVEVERDAQRRLGARPGDVRGAARGGSGAAPSAARRTSFSRGLPERDPDAAADHAHDEALLLERRAERLVGAEEDEVAVALRAVVTGRDESGTHPFPLGERRP